MSGTSGVSWKRDETLDLLAILGEKRVQDALCSSCTIMDIFKAMAEEMDKCGNKCSVQECRTKMKQMRMENGKVVQHNATSGNEPGACPYFHKLDQILKGDKTIHPSWAAHSCALGCCSLSTPSQESQVSTMAASSHFSSDSRSFHYEKDAREGTSGTTGRGEDRAPVRREPMGRG